MLRWGRKVDGGVLEGLRGDPRQRRRRGLYNFLLETRVIDLGQISTVEDLKITAQMKVLDLVVAISEDWIGLEIG